MGVSNLYTHQRTHDATRNEQCPVCMKLFKNKESVRRCITNHARIKQDYLCTWDGCKASLISPELLKRHISRTHTAPKERIKCHVCSKDYSTQPDLKRHIKFIHERPEKKFSCVLCETKFFTSKILERHMQTHAGNKFPCWFPSCLTKRGTMYDLRHHYKKRHDETNVRHPKGYTPVSERPKLTCEVCGKKLKAGASPNCTLRLHMKKHKDHTVDVCPEEGCDYKLYSNYAGYTVPGQVYQHLQATHGKAGNQVKTVYDCKKCCEKIICVQEGPRKCYEEWSKVLVQHLLKHGDEHDEAAESEKDLYKNYQTKLQGREWKMLYERHLEYYEERVFLDENSDSNITEHNMVKSEVDALEYNIMEVSISLLEEVKVKEEMIFTDEISLYESR